MLVVVQVPLALPLSVLVFFGAFVPIVGAFVAGAIAVLVALASRVCSRPSWCSVAIIVVQQVEGHVLHPLVMNRQVKLHPLAIVLVVAAGSLVAGLVGAVVAVPIAAVVNVVGKYFAGRYRDRSDAEPAAEVEPARPAPSLRPRWTRRTLVGWQTDRVLRLAGSRDARLIAIVLAWVPAVLLLDRSATLLEQRALGLLTWLLLIALLRGEAALVRVQTLVVVVFASVVEYAFSDALGVYVYRLENVPWFVPPGHGLVYLAGLRVRPICVRSTARPGADQQHGGARRRIRDLGDVPAGSARRRARRVLVPVFGGLPRVRPVAALYVGAFPVVTYLEVLGTAVGPGRGRRMTSPDLCRWVTRRPARPVDTGGSTSSR